MKIGSTDISKLYVGSAAATKAYIGATEVWAPAAPPSGYGTDFAMEVETTTASETFTIPCANVGTFNATVDWGDGTTSTITAYNDADLVHTYATAGLHEIRISGTFPNIHFNNGGDKLKLRRVMQLGNMGWTTFLRAFVGCTNMTSFVSGTCDTSSVTNMGYVFYYCTGMTVCDVSGLNTSSVTVMEYMFRDCWSLTTLDVSGFDTSSVTNMYYMFWGSGVIDVTGIDGFNITGVTSFLGFAQGCTLPTARYDAILTGWDAQVPVNSQSPHFGSSKYTAGSAAATARANLIADHLWTITDGGTA